MAYLAWTASDLGSATAFPKANIIPQNPQRRAQEYRLGAAHFTASYGQVQCPGPRG